MSKPDVVTSQEILRHLEGRLPADLPSTEIERVRSEVVKLFRVAAALRAVRLTNSDEPVATFQPFRRSE